MAVYGVDNLQSSGPRVVHTDSQMRSSEPTDREMVLELMADRITEIDGLLDDLDPDPDDPKAQRLQIRWTRTLGYLTGQYRKLLNDEDIDQLQADVELLNRAVGGSPR